MPFALPGIPALSCGHTPATSQGFAPGTPLNTAGGRRGSFPFAAAIGFSTKTVGRIERGDSTPSAEFMLRISKYFNLLVEDVFHVED